MPKYRKRPVVVEAIQFDGKNSAEILDFVGERATYIQGDNSVHIWTLEGVHKADVGDFIIKGVAGEFYPCKPDIFEKTYEPVDDNGNGQGHYEGGKFVPL